MIDDMHNLYPTATSAYTAGKNAGIEIGLKAARDAMSWLGCNAEPHDKKILEFHAYENAATAISHLLDKHYTQEKNP